MVVTLFKPQNPSKMGLRWSHIHQVRSYLRIELLKCSFITKLQCSRKKGFDFIIFQFYVKYKEQFVVLHYFFNELVSTKFAELPLWQSCLKSILWCGPQVQTSPCWSCRIHAASGCHGMAVNFRRSLLSNGRAFLQLCECVTSFSLLVLDKRFQHYW